MSDPRSDVRGVGSHTAHYNDTRYLCKCSILYCRCMVNGSAMQDPYECINACTKFYLPTISLAIFF